ncbi:unnamed protein product, partial [Laminaria digitata]
VVGAEGEAEDTGVARSGTSRYKQKLALFEARDPTDFSRRCVADPSLCRSVLRVYILGGGLRTSLEDVGKAVSEGVATGKYGNRLQRPAIDEQTTFLVSTVFFVCCTPPPSSPRPPPPLFNQPTNQPTHPETKQKTSQAMERQLIDEDTDFWEENFPGLVRERQAGAFTHVLSVIFVRGAYLYGVAEAATHGRSIIQNNNEDSPVCRAFYKIKEVTSRAGIAYSDRWTAV